jgi:DUF1365 family protein
LGKFLRLFSRNRFNLFSFYDRDHGPSEDQAIGSHIRSLLQKNKISIGNGRIMILCYPRILGYVFNPLSIYYCHDEAEELKAIIYEVNNTFGERHSYILPVTGEAPHNQSCDKTLAVSPFTKSEGQYQFQLSKPDEKIAVGIHLHDSDGPVLSARFHGWRTELDDKHLLKFFFTYPLMTLKVIVGIHVEALRIWLKGVPLQKRHTSPTYTTAFIDKE